MADRRPDETRMHGKELCPVSAVTRIQYVITSLCQIRPAKEKISSQSKYVKVNTSFFFPPIFCVSELKQMNCFQLSFCDTLCNISQFWVCVCVCFCVAYPSFPSIKLTIVCRQKAECSGEDYLHFSLCQFIFFSSQLPPGLVSLQWFLEGVWSLVFHAPSQQHWCAVKGKCNLMRLTGLYYFLFVVFHNRAISLICYPFLVDWVTHTKCFVNDW